MRKLLILLMGGIMLFLALSPFSYAAGSYPSFGPQTYQVHKYYYFGNADYFDKSRQGISISVDSSSVSYQSVKATIGLDYNIIMDRGITKFIVLANGVNVDEFEPYFDYSLTPPVYKEYYYLDINVSDQYIGSDVYFQVVALHQDNINSSNGNVYVVGWSQESPTVKLKPLPVTDNDTHGLINRSNDLLQQILNKLEDLKNSLMAKLDQINDSIKKIYEVTPETQARFDSSLANLQNKLPTKQAQDQIDTISNLMNDSANKVKNAQNDLKFGEVNYMGIRAPLLDFTEMEQSVAKLRLFIEMTLWISFFIFVIRILTPKLTA